jgi:hypothetical protein
MYNDLFDEIIQKDKRFGPILKKIKAVYLFEIQSRQLVELREYTIDILILFPIFMFYVIILFYFISILFILFLFLVLVLVLFLFLFIFI